jgi:hypothetical protein
MQKHKCPIEGCDQDAKRVYDDPGAASFATEYLIPSGKTLDEMPKSSKGHPLPLAVQHNILVECPVHGKKYIIKPGSHHVDLSKMGPRKNSQ